MSGVSMNGYVMMKKPLNPAVVVTIAKKTYEALEEAANNIR
jgi:hypothetical protein